MESDDGTNTVKPVLFQFSDGGPDRRTNYNSVKVAAIAVFVALDLDFYVHIRTAPCQSYLNPAERSMSLLNLALQNVALARDKLASPHLERIVAAQSSVKNVRSISTKFPGLKEEYEKAISPVVELLNARFSRLKWKGEKAITMEAAEEDDVIELIKLNLGYIASEVDDESDIMKLKIDKCPNLKNFIKTHCQERHYSFQVGIEITMNNII
jgi:hypothetical protein